jgi:hypothetical protein
MPALIIAVVMLIASFVITALMAKKPQEPTPLNITNFQVPQVDEGTPQAVIFGDVWVPDYQVLWYGNLFNTPIDADGGKK